MLQDRDKHLKQLNELMMTQAMLDQDITEVRQELSEHYFDHYREFTQIFLSEQSQQ